MYLTFINIHIYWRKKTPIYLCLDTCMCTKTSNYATIHDTPFYIIFIVGLLRLLHETVATLLAIGVLHIYWTNKITNKLSNCSQSILADPLFDLIRWPTHSKFASMFKSHLHFIRMWWNERAGTSPHDVLRSLVFRIRNRIQLEKAPVLFWWQKNLRNLLWFTVKKLNPRLSHLHSWFQENITSYFNVSSEIITQVDGRD
jgi:hypothetical protein